MTDRAPTTADSITSERRAAAARLPSRIAFLGFGLIGGSIAMALRAAGSTAFIAAWTPDGRGPAAGMARGILDSAAGSPGEAIEQADLIVLAGPPLAIIDAIGTLDGKPQVQLAIGATVTDVGSTKARIVAAADAAAMRFVGGHPMAGREVSGLDGATPDLFVDRPWAMVRGRAATAVDVARVEALAVATGARPIAMTADDHDAAVAAISHLPLVVAAALVDSVTGTSIDGTPWPLARRLAATGWSDMTRLARGDPEMGAGILATNAGAVTASLKALRGTLDTWIELLEAQDTSATQFRLRLAAARDALERDPDA